MEGVDDGKSPPEPSIRIEGCGSAPANRELGVTSAVDWRGGARWLSPTSWPKELVRLTSRKEERSPHHLATTYYFPFVCETGRNWTETAVTAQFEPPKRKGPCIARWGNPELDRFPLPPSRPRDQT